MGKRTERNLSGWETEIPRRIKMGLDSDSEKAKNGGKVNLTAYLFVSRALQARPYYNQPHRSHSIFYTDVSYSLDQVIIRKYC